MLNRWIRESAGGASTAFAGSGTPRDEEVERLKRDLARVTKERGRTRCIPWGPGGSIFLSMQLLEVVRGMVSMAWLAARRMQWLCDAVQFPLAPCPWVR